MVASLALMVSMAFAAVLATDAGVGAPRLDGTQGVVEGSVALIEAAAAEVAAVSCCCWCCRAWVRRELTWRMSLRLSMRRLGKFSCRNCSSGRLSPLGVMGGRRVAAAVIGGMAWRGVGVEVGRTAGRELIPVRTWETVGQVVLVLVEAIEADVAGVLTAVDGADCDDGSAGGTAVASPELTCAEACLLDNRTEACVLVDWTEVYVLEDCVEATIDVDSVVGKGWAARDNDREIIWSASGMEGAEAVTADKTGSVVPAD